MKTKKVFAGIRPTGKLHLGNYLGAMKGMVELQNDPQYDTTYMVVDAHAVTTPFDKEKLDNDSREVILGYLVAGLDPKKSIITRQSLVPQHFELMHYLSSVLTVNRMQHLPTYKEKLQQHDVASMALLNYPVLMASDILCYKGELVPVGIDQEPHLEVAREVARKMNDRYGTDFPEPKIHKTNAPYVPSLLGEGKMSKSVEGSAIAITDDLKTVKSKLAKVPTDSGSGDFVPVEGPVANLLYFVDLFQGEAKKKEYEDAYVGEGLRYKELKDDLAEAIFGEIEPLQEKRVEMEKIVDFVIEDGAKKASEVAQKTLDEVKEKMGFM